MLADRAYQPGMPLDDAAEEIFGCRGTQFHPDVVDAFRRIYDRGDLARWWDSRTFHVRAAA
jgi:HD-GYP domain-containing protein (c-di-GMP phosphodiesterase class II)